jgi:NADH:ubiquinone oxidoreductase subunit H
MLTIRDFILELNLIAVTYLVLKELVGSMWDLKLYLIDFFFYLNFFFYDFFFKALNFFDPFLQNGFLLNNSKIYYQFPQNMVFFFALKFSLCLALLILIRGGTPRYRYDYLTKLGWLKFLGFIIAVFLTSVLFFFLF